MNSDLLAKYIQAIYNYGLAIAAILAAIVLMGGGLIWLTSGGDSSKVSKAKEMIVGAITGLVILFCAWIILNTVNPNLVNLNPINITSIAKVGMGCCQYSGKAEMTTDVDCKKNGGSYKTPEVTKGTNESSNYLVSGAQCVLPGCCVTDSGTPNAVCKNKLKDDCNSSNSTFFQKSCNSLISSLSCKQGDQCQGAKNGSKCDTDQVSKIYQIDTGGPAGYCYENICWPNSGKENEPCGTMPNAACTTEFSLWKDPNNNGGVLPVPACTRPGYKNDSFGGRSCGVGLGISLACCYPQ
jgi:hypothetical protein